MTYVIKEIRAGGYTEDVLDRERFAADLAPLLGATIVPPDNDDSEMRARIGRGSAWVVLELGGLWIHISRGSYVMRRDVSRCVISAGLPRREAIKLGSSRTDYPSMTCDTDRPLDVLAREIRRKVIEPAAEPLAADRAKLAAMDADRDNLERQRAALLARFPAFERRDASGLRIDAPNESGASLYASAPGFHLSARLKPDGSLSVDRFSYSGDASALLAFLFGKES